MRHKSYKRVSIVPNVPLYYTIPLLIVFISAFLILVFLFKVEVSIVLLQSVPTNVINVSSCGTLDQDNAYYVLNQSIDVSSGQPDCLIITGNNITLDGESKYLISIPSFLGRIVDIRGSNSLIKGLNMTVLLPAISLSYGIYVNPSSNNNTISENTLSNVSFGISTSSSDSNTISRNTIISSSQRGILIASSNTRPIS